jgi:hypothetical protein
VPEFRKEERRKLRRLVPVEPIRARIGAAPVLIYDLSARGARLVHATHIARVGETLMLLIHWQGLEMMLNCEVRRTEIRHTEGESPRQVYESGLMIVFAEEPSIKALDVLMEAEARKAQIRRSISIATPPH